MYLHAMDSNKFMDRKKFWHVVNRQTEEFTEILWGRIKKHIPDFILQYFLFLDGAYLRWQGFYYRMGLYTEIDYPYDDVILYAGGGKTKLCDAPVRVNKMGHA